MDCLAIIVPITTINAPKAIQETPSYVKWTTLLKIIMEIPAWLTTTSEQVIFKVIFWGGWSTLGSKIALNKV